MRPNQPTMNKGAQAVVSSVGAPILAHPTQARLRITSTTPAHHVSLGAWIRNQWQRDPGNVLGVLTMRGEPYRAPGYCPLHPEVSSTSMSPSMTLNHPVGRWARLGAVAGLTETDNE